MEKIVVRGPNRLEGEVECHGAKNSALPILAASILSGSTSVLHNCPLLTDVDVALEILRFLGCRVTAQGHTVIIDSSSIQHVEIPDRLMREMRSSIIFLGALVSRCGETKMSYPGGCELGPRPIDLHLDALRKIGVEVAEEYGEVCCRVPKGIHGGRVSLSFPSVGATENIIIASVLAKGSTIITNAAQEPEIVDLACYLNACGARVYGAGDSTVVVEGVEKLHACEHSIMPDRIEAVTYMAMAGATCSSLFVRHAPTQALDALLPIFAETGCGLQMEPEGIFIRCKERPLAVQTIRTMPYPGFPTDAQAPIMAMLSLGRGTSIFVENMFESRYKHVYELTKMGAKIKAEGKVAVVEGVAKLMGCPVAATDLRGGAAMLVAGLAAEGVTTIGDIRHIDRGYEKVEETLRRVGADIGRMESPE